MSDPEAQLRTLAEYERLAIRRALRLTGGNAAEAARRLDIGRNTMYRKMRELELTARGSDKRESPVRSESI